MTQFNTMSNRNNRHTNRPSASSPRNAASTPGASAHSAQTGRGAMLLSRRQLLYGAVGVGAAAAVGVGVAAYSASASESTTISHLNVPNEAVTSLTEFTALDSYEDSVMVSIEAEVPYGTLVWMNDDSVAACLLPTESGSPLAQAAILRLNHESPITTLEKSIGADEHFEIYDVRATSKGIIWTEANVLKGTWRIYSSPDIENAAISATLLEEGGSSYETPTIAAVGNRAFWQVLPKDSKQDKNITSRLMMSTFGKNDTQCVFESARPMTTPVYAGTDSVTITPRIDNSTPYYQLVNIEASSGSVRSQITLPNAMTPLEAGYGDTGFMFSFTKIYNYGDGISNLGTYVPMSKPQDDYDGAKWFRFPRTPTAPPCWCNGLLIMKSTRAVCGVDLNKKTYFAIDVDDGADSYGEYLASTGSHDSFVTYTNVDHTPVEGEATHACRIKIYTTLS